MRASIAFFILTASGRPSLTSILSTVRAHPASPEPPLSERSTEAQSALEKRNIPPPQGTPEAFLTPAIILSLVLFILFSGAIISLLFYGPEIQSFIRQKLKRQNRSETESKLQSRPAPEPEPSFGFGFDGLTKEEMEAARRKEEKQATRPQLYIKLPVSPPSLVLKHLSQSPLLPFDVNHKSVIGTPVEESVPMVRTTSSNSSNSSGDAAGSSSSSCSSSGGVYSTDAIFVKLHAITPPALSSSLDSWGPLHPPEASEAIGAQQSNLSLTDQPAAHTPGLHDATVCAPECKAKDT